MWQSMVVGVLSALVFAATAGAADLEAPRPGPNAAAPATCGRCGCLAVEYVAHPQLESTYGLAYDPRNFDTAEPYFYMGPVRRYPRFFVDGVPVRERCWSW